MKPLSKLITLFFLISTFFNPQTSSAQPVPVKPLSVKVDGTVITATLTGIPIDNIEKVNIFAITGAFPATAFCPNEPCLLVQPTKEVVGTTIKWIIKDRIFGKTTYNIRAEGKNGYAFISNIEQVITGTETIDATWPLTSTTDGENAWIKGKLNNPNPDDFTASLEYSIDALDTAGTKIPSIYGPKKALKSNTNNAAEGIEADGTYYYRLVGLTASQKYSIRQTITSKNNASQIKVGVFSAKDGIIPENSVNQALSDAQRSYSLLAPLPGLNVVLDNDLCREYVTQGKPVPGGSCDNQISYFINLIIRFLIGLSVVVLVVKIIFEGYQYMVTDIPFIKASAKSKLFESFFGLLLALASFLILNTINPRLVNGGLSIDNIDLSVIKDFDISGAMTGSFDGKPIKVNFNKEAYPAAKLASEKTGVPTAFILAIFAQETGSGTNVGKCRWTDPAANMYPADKPAFQTITSELGKNVDETPLSCALKKSDGSFNGHGGAIGYTQVLPTTWLAQRLEAKGYLGHTPNPWNTGDALMVTAIYLRKGGGATNQREAACKYYAGPGNSCSTNSGIAAYGDQVMGKKLSIEKQIAASIAKGEIK